MAALTEEQSIIRDQAHAWVTEQAPVQAFRDMRDSGIADKFNRSTWSEMVDMGWTGIIIPEQYGGSELGYLTFGVVLEELGRQLTASPLFASALVGASCVVAGGSEEIKESLLPKIIDGSEIVTLAVDEGPHHAPLNTALIAEKSGPGGFVLNGTKTFVMEGMVASKIIVAARTAQSAGETKGITLFLVNAASANLHKQPMATVDSRGFAQLSFDGVEVAADQVIGELDEGYPLLEATLDRARAGLGAEMLGTGAQAFDMTLEYLKTREQFGRVIGSFQALGHRAAGLFSAMEMSRSCAEAALQSIDAGADVDVVAKACSLAQCKVGDFLHVMSNQLIQIHGGIGMTDEFDAGFYLKRARVLEALYGSQSFHRNRYAVLSGF